MFGSPVPRPQDANVLPLIWVYVYKTNGVRKARCVCNGSPRMKGTVTLDHTYAAALEQTGSRIFWALSAIHNYIVSGGDASNAFAEANSPKIPLYVRVDTAFKEWWVHHKQREPFPDDYVLPVLKALQGHPESPRAWATLINKILVDKIRLNPTTHEPCLYHGYYNGEEVLFIRQVDDFAVASKNEATCMAIIEAINKEMTIDIKDLGHLAWTLRKDLNEYNTKGNLGC